MKKSSLEAVSLASTLAQGGKVIAAVFTKSSFKNQLEKAGATIVAFQDISYSPTKHGEALAQLAKKYNSALILASATLHGKEVGALCSASLDCPFLADVVEIAGTQPLKVKHPVYAGKAIATFESKAAQNVLTLRPNVFTYADHPTTANESAEQTQIANVGEMLVDFVKSAKAKKELTESDIIVSGGRGLGGPEHFDIIEQLADALGAAVGASRAVVDAGWRPHSDQVGQTGKTVSPKLYIACAISGAVQHLAGMRSSKVIVAINKDKDAPIFKIADYGIIGDVFEVVPALTKEILKRKG